MAGDLRGGDCFRSCVNLEYVNYLIELFFIGVCILNAWIDAKRIKGGKRIYHGVNGGIYLALTFGSYFLGGWFLVLAVLIIRKVFFDVALNLFRGLPFFYFPQNPKSILDKLQYKVFNVNMEILWVVLVLLLLILNVFVLR